MIIGLALLILVGSFSTGLLDATLSKRNTAVSAASEYELEKIGAAHFNASPSPYSECFAVDTAAVPSQVDFSGSCPAGANLRADVTESDVSAGVQQWSVQIKTYPALALVGARVSVYKVDR
jgi:hypothetical protein